MRKTILISIIIPLLVSSCMGYRYLGQEKEGKFHGKGYCVYFNGDIYNGYWKDGSGYYAAQLDFVLNGERGRLFTTSSVAAEAAAR